jgi:hypothetical protein
LRKKLKNFSEKTKGWSTIFLQEKNTHSEIAPKVICEKNEICLTFERLEIFYAKNYEIFISTDQKMKN